MRRMFALHSSCIVRSSQILKKYSLVGNVLRKSSNAAVVATNQTQDGKLCDIIGKDNSGRNEEMSRKPKGSLVAAVFKNLQADSNLDIKQSNEAKIPALDASSTKLDELIVKAKNVNHLLSAAESTPNLTRKHALKIVSILAEWSSTNRIRLSDFENDSRFLRLCRMLGRTTIKKGYNAEARSEMAASDLNTVLSIAGEDEAAKLITSLRLTQMVKVICNLALRNRRSTPLLRSLAYNISSSSEQLDIKQCADVLYAMAALNFQDSVLVAKVCADIQSTLAANTNKSAVVGSILTSLGMLKYRDLDTLESLTQWIVNHASICRLQDINALFLSLAVLNFKSNILVELNSKVAQSIVQQDFARSTDWLNYVWSLTLLGLSTNKHLESVLSSAFCEKLELCESPLKANTKRKLLNLNAYAQDIAKDYIGSLLPENSSTYDVLMQHPKSKQTLVKAMLDALTSFLPANNHIQSLYNSRMGFIIDAVCVFDSKLNVLPFNDKLQNTANAIKVAIMVVDYHDTCHGPNKAANGTTELYFDLLENSGYVVLPVSFTEFSNSDKLLKRVQYLQNKIKYLVCNKTSGNN